MNQTELKLLINAPEYDFLRNNEHLGSNIILLGLGGSHAYGTNVEGSDVDIRGCSLNSKREILLGRDFEQVTNNETDTVIYSFNKMIKLLCNANPNVIELLGLKPEHYLAVSPIGQELLNNKDLFVSQIAIKSFGGYAYQQLTRLQNKSNRGKRNEYAVNKGKLAKHMMHLVRLYYMCFDILEKGEIVTYRPEREFLLQIREGRFLNGNEPIDSFYELLSSLNNRFNYDRGNTSIPQLPNYAQIEEFVMSVNERIVNGNITDNGASFNGEIHGHWINPSRNPEFVNNEFFSDCSVCGATFSEETSVCPNCKAEMDGDVDDIG